MEILQEILNLGQQYYWFTGLVAVGLISFIIYRIVDFLQVCYVKKIELPKDLEKLTPEIYEKKQARKAKRAKKHLWARFFSWLIKVGFIVVSIPWLVNFLHGKNLSYGTIYIILIVLSFVLNMLSSRLFSLWTPAGLAKDHSMATKVWSRGNMMFQAWGLASWAVPVYFLWGIFKVQGWIGSVIFLFVGQIVQLVIFIYTIKKQAVPYQKYEGLSDTFKKELHEYLKGQGLKDDEVGVLSMNMGPNAFATSLFGYRQIILTEELVTRYQDPTNPDFTMDLDDNTLQSIVAHEIGHVKNRHIEKSIFLGTFISSVVTVLVYHLFSGSPTEYKVFADSTSQQILLYWGQSIFNIMLMYPLTFFMLYRTRRNEEEADMHMLTTCGCKNAKDFFHQIRHIAPVKNLPLWHSCNMSHPSPLIREKRAIEWENEHCK